MKKNQTYSIVSALFLIVATFSQFIVKSQFSRALDLSKITMSLQSNYANDFDFSVLVQRSDSIIYTQNFGYTDGKKTEQINSSTLFNIASITKSITAIGIMKLAEQGKLNLADNIGLYLDGVPKKKQSITIRHLLSHKSGFRQTYPLENISDSDKALEIIFKQRLEFSPGSNFRYSNQNYQLLALIIEKITNSPYEEYINEVVLQPLQMNNTFCWDQVDLGQNIAPLNEQISQLIGKRNWGYIGSGGIFSTTSDLLKFWNGIHNGQFLSPTSLEELFKPNFETSSGIQIGLGFFTNVNKQMGIEENWTRGTESWGHNCVIRYFPERDLTIIVATNSGEIDNDSGKTGNRIVSDAIIEFFEVTK